jgi:hypothetical protein
MPCGRVNAAFLSSAFVGVGDGAKLLPVSTRVFPGGLATTILPKNLRIS